MNFDFNRIRSYRDEEVNETIKSLTQNETVKELIAQFFKNVPTDTVIEKLEKITTVSDFQTQIIAPILENHVAKTTNSLDFLGLEKIQKDEAYLYLSNHRDIVIDSAFLNCCIFRNKMKATEIAIGNNLLIHDWIKKFVRLNRSFIVERNLPIRQQLESSALLSAYIRNTITDRKMPIWLAQREGRAKDSNDRTQQALLKMLNMSGEKSFGENMKELKICPLTISYEYDPCDYLKAKEFQLKRDDANYKKQPQDDLTNMQVGIFGYKGKVAYVVAGTLEKEIDEIASKTTVKGELIALLADAIDKKIHENYVIYPINKVAYDMYLGENRFATEYTAEDKNQFETYLSAQVAKIDIPQKDEDFLRKKIMEMYANPLINHLKAKEL